MHILTFIKILLCTHTHTQGEIVARLAVHTTLRGESSNVACLAAAATAALS